MESRYNNTEVVYAAFFNEEGFVRNNIGSAHFFSNYNGAYSYLLKEKESYMEGESEDTQVYGRILRIPIDSVDACCDYDELLFDSGMRLTVIHEKQSYYVDVDKSMPDLSEDFRCYVGIPWKPGALVKISSSYFEKGYGILRTDPEKERVLGWIDGTVSLDVYDEVNGRWTYRNGISILSLESCTEQEVLEQKSMLESWKLMKGNQRSERAEDFPNVENTEQVIREWLNDHREYLNTLNVSDRDRKIITAFLDGERYSELARKFSLSPSRVRSLVVRFKMKVYWREREKKRSGGEL